MVSDGPEFDRMTVFPMRVLPVSLLVVAALLTSCSNNTGPAFAPSDPRRIELQQIRNLGKAFYENPATQNLAPETLRKAVDIDPESARDQLNYGLALLRAGLTEEGIAAVRKAQEMDPEIPHTWFNLGVEFKKQGEMDQALEQVRADGRADSQSRQDSLPTRNALQAAGRNR